MQTLEPGHEIVQIVDRENTEVGTCSRGEMRIRGLIHRACYIFVKNSSGDIFVQKRTTTKDIYPGYWDVAAGGVVLAGESYDLSAQREAAEELGITDCPFFAHFDHFYESGDNKVWGRVYTCLHEGPFVLQEEEVSEGKFVNPHEIAHLSESELFTPDGLQILALLLQKKIL